MTGRRRLYLDDAPGERRGVVMLDGAPERLMLERGDVAEVFGPGARVGARVRRIERGLGLCFLDLGQGADAVLQLSVAHKGLSEGAALDVRITAAARWGKGPVVQFVGVTDVAPRLIAPSPSLLERLRAAAPGEDIVGGAGAREAADDAEAAAVATEHALSGGGSLALERTRALTAVDVDVGGGGGADAKRGAGKVNRQALAAAARLLRLKGLGGLVVVDLAGRGHDGAALAAAARAAFARDMPGVVIGQVSRLGLMELALPWRDRPTVEILCDETGQPSVETLALRLARQIERAALPGRKVRAICTAEIAEVLERLSPALAERIGPRFEIRVEPGRARDASEAYTL
ncbi:MAG: ribonuclease E/G [Caulobacteraceae bacterium]